LFFAFLPHKPLGVLQVVVFQTVLVLGIEPRRIHLHSKVHQIILEVFISIADEDNFILELGGVLDHFAFIPIVRSLLRRIPPFQMGFPLTDLPHRMLVPVFHVGSGDVRIELLALLSGLVLEGNGFWDFPFMAVKGLISGGSQVLYGLGKLVGEVPLMVASSGLSVHRASSRALVSPHQVVFSPLLHEVVLSEEGQSLVAFLFGMVHLEDTLLEFFGAP